MLSRPRPLSAALALLAAHALLVPAHAQRRGSNGLQYQSDLMKGDAKDEEHLSRHFSFHMEDDQSNGVIYVKDQFQEDCRNPVALKVIAYDSAPYPEITIYDSMQEIDIVRPGPSYRGRGYVDVYANCGLGSGLGAVGAGARAPRHAADDALPLKRIK